MEPNTPQFPEAKSENGTSKTVIIAVIVVIVLVGVIWYALRMNKSAPIKEDTPTEQTTPTESTTEATPTQSAGTEESAPDTATAALSAQGTSDELGDIDADLNSTDLTTLGDVSKI